MLYDGTAGGGAGRTQEQLRRSDAAPSAPCARCPPFKLPPFPPPRGAPALTTSAKPAAAAACATRPATPTVRATRAGLVSQVRFPSRPLWGRADGASDRRARTHASEMSRHGRDGRGAR